jgi:SAM-dependent methyltransferase
MSKPGAPEFDRYADQYTDLHRANVHATGEEPSYFSRYKAQYMAARVASKITRQPIDILDFGCGVGNSIPHLRAAFPKARLHGVDPSGESIQLAERTHASEAAFRTNHGNLLPYDDHSFDLVQVACVFHHIELSQRDYWMGEIRRVLKPGGEVFVFEHNVLNPLTVRAVQECPFDEDAILLPRRELLARVRAAGFGNVRSRYIVFFPAALKFLRTLEPWLQFVPFGAQYVVHAVA